MPFFVRRSVVKPPGVNLSTLRTSCVTLNLGQGQWLGWKLLRVAGHRVERFARRFVCFLLQKSKPGSCTRVGISDEWLCFTVDHVSGQEDPTTSLPQNNPNNSSPKICAPGSTIGTNIKRFEILHT